MERLTTRNIAGVAVFKESYDCERCGEGLWRLPNYGNGSPTDKLAEYEDLEEQGLLLRLPCKVGDKVYKLWYKPCHNGNDTPDSWDCCGCEDECDLKRDIFEITVPSLEWILQHMKYFGDFVWFLAREEAEAALEKMKGEEHE